MAMTLLDVFDPQTNIDFHVVYTGLLTENQDYSQWGAQYIGRPTPNSPFGRKYRPGIIEKIKEHPKIEVDYKGYLSHQQAIAYEKWRLITQFYLEGPTGIWSPENYWNTSPHSFSLLVIRSPMQQGLAQASFAQMIDANDIDAQEKFIQKVAQLKGKAKNILPEIENWSREKISKALNVIMEQGNVQWFLTNKIIPNGAKGIYEFSFFQTYRTV